jgi:transcriptional regulator with XRE-family HTH domain
MEALNKNILKVFGANLRRIRIQKGLSQRDLSALCNVDNADISRMENGDINVTLNTVAQLADALEVPFLDLIKPKG